MEDIINTIINDEILAARAEHYARKARRGEQVRQNERHIRRNMNLPFTKGNWDRNPAEDGKYHSYHNGQVHRKNQAHRYCKFSATHHAYPYKRLYDTPEVERANHFEKIDARTSKKEAELSAAFYEYLMAVEAADDMLDQYDDIRRRNAEKQAALYSSNCIPYGNANDPNVVYFVEPEWVRYFVHHMKYNGAIPYIETNYDDTWETKHVTGARFYRNPGLIIR